MSPDPRLVAEIEFFRVIVGAAIADYEAYRSISFDEWWEKNR